MKHRTGKNNELQPADILSITRRPELRWGDVAGGELLAGQLMLNPDDPHLRELFCHVAQDQANISMQAADAFWGNYPSRGSMPALTRGRVPICTMPTGDALSIDVDDLRRNVLVLGPTGGGKSNFLAALLLSLLKVI